jgi:hypothetical protein
MGWYGDGYGDGLGSSPISVLHGSRLWIRLWREKAQGSAENDRVASQQHNTRSRNGYKRRGSPPTIAIVLSSSIFSSFISDSGLVIDVDEHHSARLVLIYHSFLHTSSDSSFLHWHAFFSHQSLRYYFVFTCRTICERASAWTPICMYYYWM